jgi:hypothetical protein
MPDEPDNVWVTSEPSPDGSTYMVSLTVGEDVAVALDRDRADRYIWAINAAINYAAYDAAVVRQMKSRPGLPMEAIGQLIVDLRKDRPPIDADATAPFRYEPVVAAKSLTPFLHIHVGGKRLGQWTLDDARQHIRHVMEVLTTADLDAAYYRCLVGLVGTEPPRARNVVMELAKWREEFG